MASEENVLSILSKPSGLELYSSGLSGSAWLLFVGVAVIIGSIIYYNVAPDNPWGVVLGAWVVGGILGFIGFYALSNALKVERLRLAAHMLRSISLHTALASEKGNSEALRLVGEMEKEERSFIARMFRAAGVDVTSAFMQSTLEGVERVTQPPYILIYRNGVLDAPSTLVANVTARTAGAIMFAFAFILLGLIMLAIGVLIGSIFVYTTARALKKHAEVENKIRQLLGLNPVPAKAPGIGGLIASIITGGLYIPLYARSLTSSIDSHIASH